MSLSGIYHYKNASVLLPLRPTKLFPSLKVPLLPVVFFLLGALLIVVRCPFELLLGVPRRCCWRTIGILSALIAVDLVELLVHPLAHGPILLLSGIEEAINRAHLLGFLSSLLFDPGSLFLADQAQQPARVLLLGGGLRGVGDCDAHEFLEALRAKQIGLTYTERASGHEIKLKGAGEHLHAYE